MKQVGLTQLKSCLILIEVRRNFHHRGDLEDYKLLLDVQTRHLGGNLLSQ